MPGAAAKAARPRAAAWAFRPPRSPCEKVEPASFPLTFEYVAQAVGSKDAEVRARVTGIVERRLYQEGATVKAGTPLFEIDPRPYQAQLGVAEAEVARAQAQKAQADRESARLAPLAERRAIGQKEADDARSQADLAAAAIKSAEAKLAEARLNLSYTRVLAPISGHHRPRAAVRGQPRDRQPDAAHDDLAAGPDLDRLQRLRERAPQARAGAADGLLQLPDTSAWEVELKLADGTKFPRSGRINFADARVNPQTGTYEMRATVANGDGAIKPGQYVRVVLKGARRVNAIAVPQAAVMDGPQGKFVYVAGKDKDGKDVAQPRPVVVGEWTQGDGNRWIVDSGLKPGDPVIVDGMARLMPGGPIMLGPPPGAPGAPRRRSAQARARRGQEVAGARPCSRASSSTARSSRR